MLASCPSGLVAEVRGLRGAEINIFSDENAARNGDMFDRVLRACVLTVQKSGPYVLHNESLVWSDVLTCDREYLLICIRIATYGPEYSVGLTCPVAVCRAKFYWDVDLRDLEILDLADETVAKFASGNNVFDLVIGETKFGFKLMTGKDEIAAMRILRKNKSQYMTTALATRVVMINGEAMSPKRVAAYFADYGHPLSDLSDAFAAVDGGVDVDIEAECSECGGRFDLKLPLVGKDFWLRQKAPVSRMHGRKKRSMRDSI